MRKTISLAYLNKLQACDEAQEEFKIRKVHSTKRVLHLLIEEQKWEWFSWLAVRLMTRKQKVEWAIYCAEQVIELYEKRYPADARPREAIKAAKAWLKHPTNAYAVNAAYAAYAADASYASSAANAGYAANAASSAANAASSAANAAYAAADANAASAANAAYAAADANAASAANAAYAYAKMRFKCVQHAIQILNQTSLKQMTLERKQLTSELE